MIHASKNSLARKARNSVENFSDKFGRGNCVILPKPATYRRQLPIRVCMREGDASCCLVKPYCISMRILFANLLAPGLLQNIVANEKH